MASRPSATVAKWAGFTARASDPSLNSIGAPVRHAVTCSLPRVDLAQNPHFCRLDQHFAVREDLATRTRFGS